MMPLSKPLLSETYRKHRLECVLAMQNEQWNNVIFNDESTFRLHSGKKQMSMAKFQAFRARP